MFFDFFSFNRKRYDGVCVHVPPPLSSIFFTLTESVEKGCVASGIKCVYLESRCREAEVKTGEIFICGWNKKERERESSGKKRHEIVIDARTQKESFAVADFKRQTAACTRLSISDTTFTNRMWQREWEQQNA